MQPPFKYLLNRRNEFLLAPHDILSKPQTIPLGPCAKVKKVNIYTNHKQMNIVWVDCAVDYWNYRERWYNHLFIENKRVYWRHWLSWYSQLFSTLNRELTNFWQVPYWVFAIVYYRVIRRLKHDLRLHLKNNATFLFLRIRMSLRNNTDRLQKLLNDYLTFI